MITKRRAVIELLFAAVIWGASFPAAKLTLLSVGPLWSASFRFMLSVLIALPVFLLPRFRRELSRETFFMALLPGLYLGATLILQNSGLQYTTVTKSSFITVLYIVLIPLIAWAVRGSTVTLSHLIWVGVALVGTALICELETGDWNRGDLLTLACAVTSSLHILRLEHLGGRIRSPFAFNVAQSSWAGVLAVAFAAPFDSIHVFPFLWESWLGIFWLSIGVTLIAFLIQIRSQQVLSSSVVSMLFLLESPFAALFAYLLFSEQLGFSQWIGAALILAAAVGTLRTHVFATNPKVVYNS